MATAQEILLREASRETWTLCPHGPVLFFVSNRDEPEGAISGKVWLQIDTRSLIIGTNSKITAKRKKSTPLVIHLVIYRLTASDFVKSETGEYWEGVMDYYPPTAHSDESLTFKVFLATDAFDSLVQCIQRQSEAENKDSAFQLSTDEIPADWNGNHLTSIVRGFTAALPLLGHSTQE